MWKLIMDKFGYELNHDLMKFLNIFCTQLRISDKLRNLIIAVIALCEHNVTATISIENLQELLSNLSKNSTQRRISRTQLELLFVELTRQEYALATSLIWYNFCGDDSTVLVRLDITGSYDDVMQYAETLGHFDSDRTRAIKDAVIKLFIPFGLSATPKTIQKPTFEALGKKLGKITDLLGNFVDAGVDEKINFDEISTQLASVMDSISSKSLALAKRLDALELQQKQEQILVLNTIENQLETQSQEISVENNKIGSELINSETEEVVGVTVQEPINSSNNNKILTSGSSKQSTKEYIKDLQKEARDRLTKSEYYSNSHVIPGVAASINSHYT